MFVALTVLLSYICLLYTSNMEPLFKTLIDEIPAPQGDMEGPLQFMVTTLDYDNFIGKIAVGRIVRGKMKTNQQVAIMNGESTRKAKIGRVSTYNGCLLYTSRCV